MYYKYKIAKLYSCHLSKNILYTRPVQRTHKKYVTFNFNVNFQFLFDLTLDFN